MWLFFLHRLPVLTAIALLLPTGAFAQQFTRDNGNCLGAADEITVACWNPSASVEPSPSYNRYPEVLPNLEGWDYRINLPHVRFQVADLGVGGPAAIVGVIEDATPITYDENARLSGNDSGHRDNSIWLFRLKQNSGFVQYKVLPSRRVAGQPENASSLSNGWRPVGPLPGPNWTPRSVRAHVIGAGVGVARILLFISDDSGAIQWTSRLLSDADTTSWPNPWVPLGLTASSHPRSRSVSRTASCSPGATPPRCAHTCVFSIPIPTRWVRRSPPSWPPSFPRSCYGTARP